MRNVIATAGLFGSAAGQRGLFVPGAHVAPAPPTVYLPEAAAPAQAVAYPVYVQPVSQTSEGWSSSALFAVGAIGGVVGALAVQGRRARSVTMAEEDVEMVAALAVGAQSDIVPRVETPADLETLAKGLNPTVGFWDPLNLAEGEFWGQSNEATIGFLRHAEIKHGRVAMAGFVGYCIHANGIHFPWKVPGDELCVPGVSPPALWQGIPIEAKWQILLTIGLFEFYSESAMAKVPGQGGHYMRGGKPGLFPPFNLPKGVKGQSGIGTLEDAEGGPLLPHPVPLNLYDPFGFNKNKSDEWKAQKLKTEINNGRLAMIGLMSLLSEGAVPGSVPLLKGVVPASGEINVMAPFDFAQPLFGNVATLAVQGRSAPVQMFSEGDIGVLPPLGVYDPLGLIETRDMRR